MSQHEIDELKLEIEILKNSVKDKSLKITQLEGLIQDILQIIKSMI